MATREPVDIRKLNLTNANDTLIYQWTPLASTDTATPVDVTGFVNFCIVTTGSFGTGNILWQGAASVSGPWVTLRRLRDASVTMSAITADEIDMIYETPMFIRPLVTGAVTSVTATLYGLRA